ncbi:nucleotide-binding domain-containing protein [Pluteus cervinus]|uniref:Nucleotide-binding domain-containing protein n=1 Tax=Pluteus cervinus TaxID=181527 RepID=A0ACD3B0V5_9AGAR|nr:nucleotide-binding domain-containing protein [Pluteus cervinus]
MASTTSEKTRVLVVGAGATGMSAAYALSHHPDKFETTVYERSLYAGGMATSVPIDKERFGADYINDGVQGASPVFYNTYAIFEKLGFVASDVEMQVSFGRDATEFWSNVFPSKAIDEFTPDIRKFGTVLKIIKAFEVLFAIISVSAMLRLFWFSKSFGDTIVFPLVALFFGTGNQTPFVSSAILERVFMDDNMRLFEYSPDTFLASIPKMKAFPRLSILYERWKSFVEEQGQGSVRVVLGREVTRIQRSSRKRGAIEVWSRPTKGTNNEQEVVDPAGSEYYEVFDEIIICTDADAALKILGSDATFLERRVLGNVKYLWDVTVTHSDLNYMEKYYRVAYDPRLASSKTKENEERRRRCEYAEKNFAPLYFIRSYPTDKSKIEMSFDLTNYQPQFDGVSPHGPRAPECEELSAPDGEEEGRGRPSRSPAQSDNSQRKIPLDRHVFQTIFLDNSPDSSGLWSKDEIQPEKVILQKWWKQQSHRWQHYAGTVPWMGLINGKNHTYFAGAWTVLNMHEIAVVSGFGAAYRLGAAYPFSKSRECKRLFALCYAVNHMKRLRAEDREGSFA